MFKRIVYEDWTHIVPVLAFWLTFGVFLAITVRALFLKKDYVNHMRNLPLEDDSPQSNHRA